MKHPSEAYREGYEKGRTDSLGGKLAQVTMGMLHDDPGGHFEAGYRDGAAKNKFAPPSDEVPKTQPPRQPLRTNASDLEKAWYALCDGSAFITQGTVDEYITALQAAGKHAAIVVGLSDFTGHSCPRCGDSGQFKIRFLGRIEHPNQCGWRGYMRTGSYIGFQFSEIVHSSIHAGGSMKDDADRKGDRSGGWINGVFGFMMVAVLRAALAIVLIPLHAIVALSLGNQSGPERRRPV